MVVLVRGRSYHRGCVTRVLSRGGGFMAVIPSLQSVLIAEPDEVPIFVDELHPDVLAIVDEVMANAKFEDADLPVTSIAIDTLTEAIANAEEERLQRLPSTSRSVVCCRSHQ